MSNFKGNHGEFISIYSNEGKYYLRLCPIETPKFMHGIALFESYSTKELARQDAEAIEEYIRQWLAMEKDSKVEL